MSYGRVKRGSNQLWDYFVKCIDQKFDVFTLEQRIDLLNGLMGSEFRAKELISRLENTIFSEQSLASAVDDRSHLLLYNLLATVFQKTGNLNTDHVEMVENLTLEKWEELPTALQAMVMDLYAKTGNKSEVLSKKFEILSHTIERLQKEAKEGNPGG
jgi:two-component SAPR family response regulator